jgi:hypothetical protein
MTWIGTGHAVQQWNGTWQLTWPCGCSALVDESGYGGFGICLEHMSVWHETQSARERAIAHYEQVIAKTGDVLREEIARLHDEIAGIRRRQP